MATPVSYNQQYCPIARGLDLLGDRWTLLIVREVAAGPQRFSDLQRNLPGIAATVLTQRLRSMAEDGLVEVHFDDESPRKTKYALGPSGQRALPVLASLVQFGMPLLEEPNDDTVVRPIMGVRAGILAFFNAAAAAGISETYGIHLGDEVFTINSRAKTIEAESKPDLKITFPNAQQIVDIRKGRANFGELVKRGSIKTEGSSVALKHFQRIFRLDSATSELA